MENTQHSLSGKMSPELSVATKERTSASSLKNSSKSSSRQPLCLRFRKADGPMPTVTSDTDGALLTEFLMLNTGESPSVAVESTLSSILEANAPEKYYLSAKACEGILRRAERRGKQLPPMLKEALEQMIERSAGIAAREGGHIYEGVAGTLRANAGDNQMAVAYSIENHPADSRVNIDDSGKVQTLTSRMGTGGGNVPMVMEQVYCLQGNGIDRADTAGCNGRGWNDETCYTLNTIDRPAVAYCTDVGFFNSQEDVAPTLLARSYKDPHLVSYPKGVRYIVRRLTPTECARLQGFADGWGYLDKKEDFTDEEYQFWLNVRNTHAEINGKQVKEYTKEQMLTWYSKLHTDSAEYKMWGNGIALPPALYCMEGISEVLCRE